ncbi:MAG TPA: Rieske (2Fe-2S) protein, partial [Acidimicrobiales bacterium]|nr:Rieske (2Fe-2S) protein [Acidimicrobiales bacterium]
MEGVREKGPGLTVGPPSRPAPHFGLPRRAHLDLELYQLELELIWRTNWLFAAHSCELSRPGDRLVFDVADDSILLLRDASGKARAFHNFCRHRGTRLVDIASGLGAGPRASGPVLPGASRPGTPVAGPQSEIGAGFAVPGDGGSMIRCPYHQWTYRLDGALVACGGMERVDGLERDQYGLVPVECSEVGGLIFVRLAQGPLEPGTERGTGGGGGRGLGGPAGGEPHI